jgi:hypothetical protein
MNELEFNHGWTLGPAIHGNQFAAFGPGKDRRGELV